MFDSRKQNRNCRFAEEIVSFIYEEMSHAEKASFETHLNNCNSCPEEIAAFSAVSFSVQEWRDTEFADIATPQIEIPYETAQVPAVKVETVSDSRGWFGNLFDLLNPSAAIVKTATAFSALAIVFTLGWFLLDSDSTQSLKVGDRKGIDKQIEKEKPNNRETIQHAGNDTFADVTKDNSETLDESKKRHDELAVNTPTPKSVKTTSNPKVIKVKAVRKTTAKTNKRVTKNRKSNHKNMKKKSVGKTPQKQETIELQQVPGLTDFAIEESDEKDIRLTDLFEDDESGD